MEYEVVSPTEKLRLELSQNVDLIKVKRLCKKQSAYITSLEAQIKSLNEETDYLRSCVEISAIDKENTVKQLISEKELANKLKAEVAIFKGHMDTLKEQLQDLQSEKAVLKLHNENLLQLSSKKDNKLNTDQRIKNLNEVEGRLKVELITTRELAGKLSESELRVAKLEHELDKQTDLVQNLQRKTLELKDYNTEISNQLENTIGNKRREKCVKKFNKATSTNISTNGDTFTKDSNDNEKLNKMCDAFSTKESELVAASECSRLSKDENRKELQQCRHLLRIQHSLNQQCKSEIDQLQKVAHNKQFQNDMIKCVQEIILEHLETLKKLKNNDMDEIFLNFTKSQLENLPHILKQILLYHLTKFHEIVNETSNEINEIEKEGVDIVLEEQKIGSNSKFDRRGSYTIQPTQHYKMISSMSHANIDLNQLDNQINSYEYSVKFKFSIGQAKFEQFPQHLKRYSENPKIFLTWSFYSEDDDNNQQAYTDVKSIHNATFDCTCEYEGYYSPGFLHYLKMEGMNIEVHLVQDEISVRIAQIVVDTSQCIENINHLCSTTCEIIGDQVQGLLDCNFKLICDDKIIQHYIAS